MSSKRTKTLAQADQALRREVKAILRLKKRAASEGKRFITTVVQIGRRLDAVKGRVGHGNWLPWLRENFDWSGETAANYIAAFRLSKSPKFLSLKNLPLEMIYLLGRRGVAEEARAAVAAQVEAGEKVTFPITKKTDRIVSHYRPVAKTIAPATGEAVHTIRPPIPQEAMSSNVQFASPEYAPPDCELTRHPDMIFNKICYLAGSFAGSITEWFAAVDATTYIASVPEAQRETLIKDLDKIKPLAALLTQAQITREHSSVN